MTRKKDQTNLGAVACQLWEVRRAARVYFRLILVSFICFILCETAVGQNCPVRGQIVGTNGQRQCITNLTIASVVVPGYGRTVEELVMRRSLSWQGNYVIAISRLGSCKAIAIAFGSTTGILNSAADLQRLALASCAKSGCECELAVHSDRVYLRRVEREAENIQTAGQPSPALARMPQASQSETVASPTSPPASARPEGLANSRPPADISNQSLASVAAAAVADSERARLLDDRRRKDELSAQTSDELVKTKQRLALAEKALADARSAEDARQNALAVPKLAQRKALVIGNDNYQRVAKLQTAVADAKEVSKALKSLGFDVTVHTDLDSSAMRAAAREFKGRIQSGDDIVFFFAGHGVQISGSNYLLPISVRGENEDEVRDEAILLQRILDDTQDKSAGFTLAIVDACRNNPFRTSGRAIGGARGLVPTSAATGQMIIFSAGAGQEALDKLGQTDKDPNGLFTRVFIREMQAPGVSVDKLLRNVRNEVVKLAKSVGHEQTPALYDQTLGEFYFKR